MTTDELCEFLGVTRSTVYEWRRQGTAPPAYRIGKVLRWRADEVDTWLDARHDDGRVRR